MLKSRVDDDTKDAKAHDGSSDFGEGAHVAVFGAESLSDAEAHQRSHENGEEDGHKMNPKVRIVKEVLSGSIDDNFGHESKSDRVFINVKSHMENLGTNP